MAKPPKMNLRTGPRTKLPGTDLGVHPANFPLGSIESRAAARSLIARGRLRSGDKGTLKCGCTFMASDALDDKGRGTGRLVQVIFPKSFADIPLAGQPEHTHDFEVIR